jgi:hypothetical protein
LLIVVVCLATASLASGEPPDARAAREVPGLEAQFGRAVVEGDRAFFDRVLADDFTHPSHAGVFKTKAEWRAEDKCGDKGDSRGSRTRSDSYDIDDLAIRISGNTAVVTGRTRPQGRNAQGQPISGQYRSLRVWVKQQGRWQAGAFQGTCVARP